MPGKHQTSQADHSRDPCPYVILNDLGAGFTMGAIGGGIWHGIKGARNSPKGFRFEGALTGMKSRAPVVAGNLAAWSGLLSAFNCLAVEYRQKEDGWNTVLAGAATGGCLAVRGGPRVAFGSAVGGAIVMGVFEGVSVLLHRSLADANRPVAPSTEFPSTSAGS